MATGGAGAPGSSATPSRSGPSVTPSEGRRAARESKKAAAKADNAAAKNSDSGSTKQPGEKERASGWMITAGVVSCMTGTILLAVSAYLLLVDPSNKWAYCETVTTTERPVQATDPAPDAAPTPTSQPAPSGAAPAGTGGDGDATGATEMVESTCKAPSLTGAALVPALLGGLLVLPAVRILAKNLEISLGPVTFKENPPSLPEQIEQKGTDAVRAFADVPLLRVSEDRLRELVQPPGESSKGLVRRVLDSLQLLL